MTQSAYLRAVKLFEKLSEVPVTGAYKSPAAFSKAVGLPKSSGYRGISALEADGFLRRDENGVYVRGPAAIRTGLAAFCSGHVAPVAQPILVQLRQSTQYSAFMGLYADFTLSIGPHSIGRESSQTKIERSYHFDGFSELVPGQVIESSLRSVDSDLMRRIGVLLAPISVDASSAVVLGLILNATRDVTSHMTETLQSACAQVQNVTGAS